LFLVELFSNQKRRRMKMWRRFVIPLNLSFLVGRVERRVSPDDIFKAKDPDLIQSMAAMKRAALEARKIAIRTGTSIIVRDNGRIIRRSAKELERELQGQIVEDQAL
jgi:hypothetical protein